ncbi:DnaD domain-containing protein [Lentibacillus salinarum]|uniref:DnaD domain-containing protein n=1 Tax=Lentibacillus salinarum TaxID=446820 RepID=A0ABW3ZT54_9BACI
MNYIKQINAFYHQLEINPLSSSAISLWHALLHVNNKARWKETFTVASTVLLVKSNLTESTFKRARHELKEKGYITYTANGSNRASSYRIYCLSSTMDQQSDDSEDAVSDHGMDCSAGHAQDGPTDDEHSTDHVVDGDRDHSLDRTTNRTAAPLVKHKQKDKQKPKQNETNTADDDAIGFYQENFGIASPFVVDSIVNWCHDMGEPLVTEAMKRALERNKTSWGYVKSILQAWAKSNIRTVEAARAEETAFRQKQASRHVNTAPQEVVPDWFIERKKKRTSAPKEVPQLTPEQIAETDRLLAEFTSQSG